MHLLEIAATQPALGNHLGIFGAQTLIHGKVSVISSRPFLSGNEKRLSAWKFFGITKNLNFNVGRREMPSGGFVIKAVATLEPKCLVNNGDLGPNKSQLGMGKRPPTVQTSTLSEGFDDLDEKERLRRMRISKANKGNTPWNKGKKHSPETLRRIRERTRLAMQDPKVKMKLVNLGHAQTVETRKKIGAGVQMGWQRRRQKLLLQETCYFKWQNLIAENSRRGLDSEDELQWNSYEILNEQLKKAWLECVEMRKSMPRPKGSKRAPKSPEQRRKISEAISLKWADSGYRERVVSALAKYHGIEPRTERKLRRKPTDGSQSHPAKKNASDANKSSKGEVKIQTPRPEPRKRNAPLYKDPLASSKLDMLKNIRAQRAAAETKKIEAIERARLLIAEAEEAAKALEAAAVKSPIARAFLIETRKLLAEAVQSIESIEAEQISSRGNGEDPLAVPDELGSQVEKHIVAATKIVAEAKPAKVNGFRTLASSGEEDSHFGKVNLQDILNVEKVHFLMSSSDYNFSPFIYETLMRQSDSRNENGQLGPNKRREQQEKPVLNGARIETPREETPAAITLNEQTPAMVGTSVSKKWVCGRLVEVAEGAV